MSPLGSPASSTQVPWELLWRLLCQVTPRRSLAGIPLRASCMAVPLSFVSTDSLRAHYMLSDARASARANAMDFRTSACTYRDRLYLGNGRRGAYASRRGAAPPGPTSASDEGGGKAVPQERPAGERGA